MDGTLGEVIGEAPVTVLDGRLSARPLPDAVRVSLEAVKAAQRAARERNRRETWKARALVTGVAAFVAIGGGVVWPRIHAGKTARAAAAVFAPPSRPALATTGNPPSATGLAPEGMLAAGTGILPVVKESAAATPGAISFDTCHDSYQGQRWRAAAAACATAFAARPDDAKLALRVAEAEYARDHLAEARDWAQRTLARDATQADALAILGRSEQRTGHGEAAARAFRRYLAVAPRGWHAAEARAALHANRRLAVVAPVATATSDETAASPSPPAIEPAATKPAAFSPPFPATAPPDAP